MEAYPEFQRRLNSELFKKINNRPLHLDNLGGAVYVSGKVSFHVCQ